MRIRTTLLAVAVMALDGLLGYAAACGQFTLIRHARPLHPTQMTTS